MNRQPNRSKRPSPPYTMQGVTLIETMISLTIGLVILAGIGYAYLGSRQNFRTQDVLGRMQESARTAFEILDRDIRMTGYLGCPPNSGANSDVNVLSSSTDWDKNLLLQPLVGYEKDSATAWSAFPAGVTGVVGNVAAGDALTVLHADNSKQYFVFSDNNGTSQLTLTANHDIAQNQIMIATNCGTHSAIFQKTNSCTLSNGNCGNKIVQYGRSTAIATTQLGNDAGTLKYNDPTGFGLPNASVIFPLSAVTYYIGTNATTNEPTLYRQVAVTASTTRQDELIEGVQDMQLSFGVDTVNNPPSAITAYVSASGVADWSQVIGIRVSLLMVSRQSEQRITTTDQPYSLDLDGNGVIGNGETFTPTDGLYRKVFTTTIAVKNRL